MSVNCYRVHRVVSAATAREIDVTDMGYNCNKEASNVLHTQVSPDLRD
jgi:hypothetical protein